MDGVSGVIAIVSFSIQLVESIQKANKFLKEVRNAPEEVVKLADTLDEFEHLLIAVDGLIKRQSTTDGLPSPIEIIEHALRRCRSTITTLETCINTIKAYFDRHGRLHKAWASIRSTGKKDEVEKLRREVESDMSKLRTALNINISHLQLHQIELITTCPSQDISVQHTKSATYTSVSNLAKPRDLVASHKNSILKIKEKHIWRYQTLFGEFRLRKKYVFLKASGNCPENALSEESHLIFIPYLLRTAFELRSFEGFSQVPRSLSLFPVIQDDWSFYEWCFPENMDAFKQALSRRELSPFSKNKSGQTFLHEAIRCNNVELCSLLIQIGVDVNYKDNHGEKALHLISAGKECKAEIVRTLLKANCDFELEDLYGVFECQYWGSPEAAELLLLACGISSDAELVSSEGFPFLTVALREFGVGKTSWKTWIRRLLDCKADVHISRSGGLPDDSLLEISYRTYTALDDLFKNTECPFEAGWIAQDWLVMLAEAGFGVKQYLEKEKYLHSKQNYLIEPHWMGCDRQLVFELDGKPRIGWEWWFDPLSRGSLVCHEFRNLNLVHEISFFRISQDLWKDVWPFNYPEWSDYNDPKKPIFPLISQAQDLQNWEERRIKPWQKLKRNAACRHARQTRIKYPQYFRELNNKPPMPGAWIGD